MRTKKKVLLAVFIPLLVLVLAFAGLAAYVLVPTSSGVASGELSHAYGTVLADIPGITDADPRYVDLAFLGSHDSFSYAITPDSPPDDLVSGTIRSLLPLIKNFIARFAVTQNVGIYDQLMQGARFLQLKITLYNDEWYTAHTLLSVKMEECLVDILRYLSSDAAKGEIVGILFQPNTLGDGSFADLHEAIASVRYNGVNLFDFVHYSQADAFDRNEDGVSLGKLRYNDVTANGAAAGVVLFDRRDEHYQDAWDAKPDPYPYFYDLDACAFHPWHNRCSAKLLIDDIVAACRSALDPSYEDKLRINQTQASVSVRSALDVFGELTSHSLLRFSEKHNLALIERDFFFELLHAMPIFQVDFLTSSTGDFNTRINAMIREYNEKLVTNSEK